jgi:hypothetical protein
MSPYPSRVQGHTIFAQSIVGGADATLNRRYLTGLKARIVIVIHAFTRRLEGFLERVKFEYFRHLRNLAVHKQSFGKFLTHVPEKHYAKPLTFFRDGPVYHVHFPDTVGRHTKMIFLHGETSGIERASANHTDPQNLRFDIVGCTAKEYSGGTPALSEKLLSYGAWKTVGPEARDGLRRFLDPPKNFCHDFPLVFAIQNNRFVVSALRL